MRILILMCMQFICVAVFSQNNIDLKEASKAQVDSGFAMDKEGKYKEEFRHYEKAIELDAHNSLALINLARCYEQGLGVTKDEKKAMEAYLRAADEKSVYGLWAVGKYYQAGATVEKSDSIAFEYFTKAAELPKDWASKYAYYSIGAAYYYAKWVQKNDSAALAWYIKAGNEGHVDAYVEAGYIYDKSENYKEAFYWYSKAAEAKDDIGLHDLACMYRDGKGVKQDYKKALYYFKKASDLGFAGSQNSIGHMYEYGQLGKPNYTNALSWYTLAASSGHGLGMYNLGKMYYYGQGVDVDKAKTVEWYIKSADTGEKLAQYNLAIEYERGEYVKKDTAKALELYEAAGNQGYASAKNNYAWLCALQNKNLEKAAEMSKESIELAPNDYTKMDTYAYILFLQNNLNDAEYWQSKAMKLIDKKESAGYWERYGDILYKLGKKDEALKQWNIAAKMPGHSAKTEEKVKQQRYIE